MCLISGTTKWCIIIHNNATWVSSCWKNNVKLQQQVHESWIDAKCYFQINSDDALAKHLLKLATHSTVSSDGL